MARVNYEVGMWIVRVSNSLWGSREGWVGEGRWDRLGILRFVNSGKVYVIVV